MDGCDLLHFSQPRLPLEIQEYIIEALDYNFASPFFNYIKQYRILLSCCLVCRGWVRSSQKILFTCVILPDAHRFDKLCNLHDNTPHPSHLFAHIRSISFRYDRACHKLGQVIPRLAMLHLPSFERLELITHASGRVLFPFHHSLVVYASKLAHIKVLHLLGFSFNNLLELRRFVSVFPGLDRLECNGLRYAADQLGNFRSLYWIRNQGLRTVKLVPFSRKPSEADDVPEDPTLFWIAALQQDHSPPLPSLTAIYPTLTSDAVEVLVGIRRILYDEDALQWSLIDNNCQQWELHSPTCYTSFRFSTLRHAVPNPVQAPIRPVFSPDNLLSIQFRVFTEGYPGWLPLRRLEEFFGRLGNLEELRLEVHQYPNTDPSPEKQKGIGQLYAEYLPQTRQRCNLRITTHDGGPVNWRHLFDEETDEHDKTDYRDLGRPSTPFIPPLPSPPYPSPPSPLFSPQPTLSLLPSAFLSPVLSPATLSPPPSPILSPRIPPPPPPLLPLSDSLSSTSNPPISSTPLSPAKLPHILHLIEEDQKLKNPREYDITMP